ncbi:MAG: DUF4336 domain-containing protein [Candidatus Binataceae bacterium]
MPTNPALRNLAPGLWVADRPFKLPLILGDIRSRMTVIRLADGSLFLHSPILLDSETRAALDEIGPVRAIIAPSKAHHLFAGDYVKAYPEAKLHGAPGLADKRKDLTFASILDDEAATDWRGQIEQHLFRGAPFLNEVVFYHRATHTLIFTDLVFNVSRQDAAQARVFNWISGAPGHFGPHRLVRRAISDHEAARASVAGILRWDFDRVIVSHGDVLASGGHARVRAAFSYL